MQWRQVNNSLWLTNQSVRLISLLLNSYEKAFDESLLSSSSNNIKSNRHKAAILFTMPHPVIAHDNAKDPCIKYANAAALHLWSRCWDEMIGMPSRLTAPEKERAKRQEALLNVSEKHVLENYQGVRVNSKGDYFIIKNARIWTIWDEHNMIYGQAATFADWCRI